MDGPVELSDGELDHVVGGAGSMPPPPTGGDLNIQNISQFIQQVSSGAESVNSYSQSASITQG